MEEVRIRMRYLKEYKEWLIESDTWSTVTVDDEDDRTRKIRQIIQASKSNDPDKRSNAIRSSLTPAAVLMKLSDDPDDFVRVKVAAHKNTPGKVLDKLSRDKSEYVLIEVAKNVKTPKGALAYLSSNNSLVKFSAKIRKLVAMNPNRSLETLIKLSRDSNDNVRYIADTKLTEVKANAEAKGDDAKLEEIERIESMSDLGVHGDVDSLNLDDLDI